MDIVSTKLTSAMATNVSTNSHNKKRKYKMDSYILHTVLWMFVFLDPRPLALSPHLVGPRPPKCFNTE